MGQKSGGKTSQPQVSRKEARKLERLERKKRKADFFSAPQKALKRCADDEHAESPKRKKARVVDLPKASITECGPTGILKPPLSDPDKSKSKRPQKVIPRKHAPTPSLSLDISGTQGRTQKEQDEDGYIAYLESKLGYNRTDKMTRRALVDDGLDDLFDLASAITPHQQARESEHHRDDSSSDDSDFDNESEESHGIQSPAANDSILSTSGMNTSKSKDISATRSRYIPPQLRNSPRPDVQSVLDDTIKLQRQLKGLLNRMSEQNMMNILNSIEEAYRDHRRHDVTSTLTTLIIDGISSHSLLLDSYVVLYAAFVSCLHKLIGVEFASYFIQNVIITYEQHYKSLDKARPTDEEMRGKECSNLIVLISELYNFQVISSILVFDIIRVLLHEATAEFNVELLLKIVRNSGQQLRRDDPSAFKDIIQIVQTKLGDQTDSLSSRTRFMVETLINLKNNKLKRNITQNQGGDAVERMKKFLSGLSKKRHVLALEPLHVSLEDLHSAESKGKWWLVGAAWGGNPLLDRREALLQKQDSVVGDINDNALVKLARKQGMNTDVRRRIFVALMSSDDYVNACERLSQLKLTEIQQREIVRVLLHCCGMEKSYNPYYTLVGQQLSRSSHSYKITLQFCLWDFLRELGETNVGGLEVIKNLKDDGDSFGGSKKISSARIKNVAKAYAWWIAKDCSSLVILKPVDFTILKPQTGEFLTELFTQLFISSQTSVPTLGPHSNEFQMVEQNREAVHEIFIKVTRMENLAMGLIYFMSKTFHANTDNEMVKWASEVALETLQTG